MHATSGSAAEGAVDSDDAPVLTRCRAQNVHMAELTDEEVHELQSWLDANRFERVSSVGGDNAGFGDRQDVWERGGTRLRVTRDRGQWFYDLSRSGASVWLDVDRVVEAMGYKSARAMERAADVASFVDDRVFESLKTVVRHSP